MHIKVNIHVDIKSVCIYIYIDINKYVFIYQNIYMYMNIHRYICIYICI